MQPEHSDFERSEFVLVTQNFADVRAYPERIVIADCPPQHEAVELLLVASLGMKGGSNISYFTKFQKEQSKK